MVTHKGLLQRARARAEDPYKGGGPTSGADAPTTTRHEDDPFDGIIPFLWHLKSLRHRERAIRVHDVHGDVHCGVADEDGVEVATFCCFGQQVVQLKKRSAML